MSRIHTFHRSRKKGSVDVWLAFHIGTLLGDPWNLAYARLYVGDYFTVVGCSWESIASAQCLDTFLEICQRPISLPEMKSRSEQIFRQSRSARAAPDPSRISSVKEEFREERPERFCGTPLGDLSVDRTSASWV